MSSNHPQLPPGALMAQNPSPAARLPPTVHDDYYDETPLATMRFPSPWETAPFEPELNVLPESRPPSRAATTSSYAPYDHSDLTPPSLSFPEPQIFRSVSANAFALRPPPPASYGHRYTRSDGAVNVSSIGLHRDPSSMSVASSAYYGSEDMAFSEESHGGSVADVTAQLSDLSFEEGLECFQRGLLNESEHEWHKLVPREALDALPKKEIARQSVIFELINSEREYVADLETIIEVFIDRLSNSNPPVIPPPVVRIFTSNIFGNIHEILAHHQRLLAALFARQRDTHPLIQSIADIILDSVVKEDFRSQYEQYIKHYPIAESQHRLEMRRNPRYREFVHSSSNYPNVKKRDLVTFLARPVTRLPRLKLLLDAILKETDKENSHPDLETLPLISGILSTLVKGTQPGIEAAENKVRFWELCESLVFRKGEIIDMDLYNEQRTFVYAGPVVRKARSDSQSTSVKLALLDHYLLILKEDKRPNGAVRNLLISRPIPLDYLRLGSFNGPSEFKRDPNDDSLLARRNIPMHPFTLYHAASSMERRYVFYVASEALRDKWYAQLKDALGVHHAYQEANMYFQLQTLSERFFKFPSTFGGSVPSTTASDEWTGRISCAVPFTSHHRRFIAVGCTTGIYVAPRGTDKFRKVLGYRSPLTLLALSTMDQKVFNKFMVLTDNMFVSYSLDLIARVATGDAEAKTLSASLEHIAGGDSNVLFAKQAVVDGRMLVIYASRKFLSSTIHLHALEVLDVSQLSMKPNRINHSKISRSFRVLGEPGYVPKDTTSISTLAKTIGVCTSDGILVMNPVDLARSQTALVPDLRETSNSGENVLLAVLKHRIEIAERARPLGFAKVPSEGDNERLVVYDKLGVYITRHGLPTRNYGFLKWETAATDFAVCGPRLLLFSSGFVEVRDIATGVFQQAIEGRDIRLLWNPSSIGLGITKPEGGGEPTLIALRSGGVVSGGESKDKIAELLETREIPASGQPPAVPPKDFPTTAGGSRSHPAAVPAMWAEWDM